MHIDTSPFLSKGKKRNGMFEKDTLIQNYLQFWNIFKFNCSKGKYTLFRFLVLLSTCTKRYDVHFFCCLCQCCLSHGLTKLVAHCDIYPLICTFVYLVRTGLTFSKEIGRMTMRKYMKRQIVLLQWNKLVHQKPRLTAKNIAVSKIKKLFLIKQRL